MPWNLTTILILLVVLFAGYGIGLLEMHLRRQKRIKQLEAALQAQPPMQAGAPVVSASVPANPGLLRLSSGDDQSLKLELDGASLGSPASVTPQQRRRLVTILNGLRPWVEAGPLAPVTRTGPDQSDVPADLVPPLPPTPVEVVPVFNRRAKPAQPAPAAQSIVAQIDEILQSRLVGTPLAARRIRLGETPGGEVLVFIGADRYDGLEAVPDQEVVTVIRSAIAEWEKKVK